MASTSDLVMAVEEGGEEGGEETTSDVLVKLLMSRNISVDVINDSHFQALLKSVAQQGEEACKFLENSTVVQKSLWKFEHEVKQYMQMVIRSWKTTGVSVMSYNLKGARVLGFYSPKGFIFLEEGSTEEENRNALTDLVPDLPYSWGDVMQFVRHDSFYRPECQYQAVGRTSVDENFFGAHEAKCIRQQIHALWRIFCEKSEWVQTLIKKSDQLYESMVSCHSYGVFHNSLKQKRIKQAFGWKPACSFSRLHMVMKLELELKACASSLSRIDAGVTEIINNDEFWDNGNELLIVLTPFFEIPSLMDTLVPSAGYLELALDKAKDLLETYSENEPLKYTQIWESFENWGQNCTHSVQDLTFVLNPCYFSRQDLHENISIGDLTPFLYDLVGAYDDEEERVLDVEIGRYCSELSNPFTDISISEWEANHPITLWSKYGGGFPLLQKCAYKLLSQPACCLCKQVEKHASKIRGSDNFILRLNCLMMEEFTKMGDQIYQPIHV